MALSLVKTNLSTTTPTTHYSGRSLPFGRIQQNLPYYDLVLGLTGQGAGEPLDQCRGSHPHPLRMRGRMRRRLAVHSFFAGLHDCGETSSKP